MTRSFELDSSLQTVSCKQCIQLWTFHSKDQKGPLCGPHASTCEGNACFMRQCKQCGAYQYMSGCLTLTKWQLMDLQIARQKTEMVATRAGATMLCQDNDNHTTCICNRKDKCNDIHMRIPFSTYSGSGFSSILQVDEAIARLDPHFGQDTMLWNPLQRLNRDPRKQNSSSSRQKQTFVALLVFILIIYNI
uniref:Zf-3CxxC domain-containing protein n=1 Tax=Rhabditophanes sp. KR3021 TaxID=114890 RepID=A0AC35TLC4_9BILA